METERNYAVQSKKSFCLFAIYWPEVGSRKEPFMGKYQGWIHGNPTRED
jgi:hypothetical protein